MDADDRTLVQELLRRHEKATDAMVRELNALTRRVDAGTDALVRRTDPLIARMEAQGYQFVQQMEAQPRQMEAQTRQMEAQTGQMEAQRREFTEESRAQRAALFRIFDRLDEGGSAAGA